MKKLLVLSLVLGLASLAAAATVELTIDGMVNPIDSEIVLMPSESLILGVNGAIAGGADSANMMLVLVGPATLDGANAVYGGNPDLSGPFDPIYLDYYFLPAVGRVGAPAYAGYVSDLAAVAGQLLDGIVFHCEGEGDVIVELYSSADSGGTWDLVDTAIIHQVPEPATMALLGDRNWYLPKWLGKVLPKVSFTH